MTKEELKQEADRLGLRVYGSFMDDLLENVIIVAISFVCGVIGHMIWKAF